MEQARMMHDPVAAWFARQPTWGAPTAPQWFLMVSRPGQDAKAATALRDEGCEAWFPTEVVWRRGYKGKPGREIEKPFAPGYVFACIKREVLWPSLIARFPKVLRGVVSDNRGIPRPIRDAEMMAMTRLPETLAEMQRAAAEARRIKKGDMVTIRDPRFPEWQVQVEEITGPWAKVLLPFFGGEREVQVAVERMSKVAN